MESYLISQCELSHELCQDIARFKMRFWNYDLDAQLT